MAINKCTDAEGRVVYTDAACPGGASAKKVGPEPPKPAPYKPPALSDAEIRFKKALDEVEVQQKKYEGQKKATLAKYANHPRWKQYVTSMDVAVGMPYDLAYAIAGMPDDVNRTRSLHGSREQWVYQRSGGSRYIYTEGGVVTTIQD